MRSKLKKEIRIWLCLFIILLALSGITAFPLRWELTILQSLTSYMPDGIKLWIEKVNTGLIETDEKYPFIFYGTDWLAFAHIILSILFIGPYREPVKNKWVIEFGIISCVLVLPLAFIAGPIRGIPFAWQLIDCSFGVIGIIPLYIIRKKIIQLESHD